MTPQERTVAVLRMRRASLADSERRRFKEERKWALSQGTLCTRLPEHPYHLPAHSIIARTSNRADFLL